MKQIKVLIIDDSALTRSVLQHIINADPMLEVVGTAIDPIFAAKKIQQVNPDVITLDLEMPRMDGLTFLKKLMVTSPRPVVIISGNSPRASSNAIKALENGALEIIEKPDVSSPEKLDEVSENICHSIKMAAEARLVSNLPKTTAVPFASTEKIKDAQASHQFYVIGSSTGGPDVLREIFESLENNIPGCVVAQHMPAPFTRNFADRLNATSRLSVKEAVSGDYILNNRVLIIPGDQHGVIKKDGKGYYLQLNQDEKVNRHRPSVDVLFLSAAQVAGARATGILLTGMGEDGARGLLAMKQAGSVTVAQDESTCVVYGMPRKAVELNAAQYVLSRTEIINLMRDHSQ